MSPKDTLAPAILKRVQKDHEKVYDKLTSKFESIVAKLVITNLELSLRKEDAN